MKKIWFKRKRYGWGWAPSTWQGWAVLLVYVALIITLASSREKYIPGNPNSGSNLLVFGLPIILLTAFLIFICYKKGEKPRWQWGSEEQD